MKKGDLVICRTESQSWPGAPVHPLDRDPTPGIVLQVRWDPHPHGDPRAAPEGGGPWPWSDHSEVQVLWPGEGVREHRMSDLLPVGEHLLEMQELEIREEEDPALWPEEVWT